MTNDERKWNDLDLDDDWIGLDDWKAVTNLISVIGIGDMVFSRQTPNAVTTPHVLLRDTVQVQIVQHSIQFLNTSHSQIKINY